MSFSEALELEETERRRGYESGLDAASVSGNPEGTHLGFHRGTAVGFQIGYYYGVVLYHEALLRRNPDICNDKVIKQLTKLKELIDNFPVENVNEDILNLISDIQAQYKKLCSLLKIKPFCPDANYVTF